jgi:hypothetical protein
LWNLKKDGADKKSVPFLLVGTPRCGVRSAQRADPTLKIYE